MKCTLPPVTRYPSPATLHPRKRPPEACTTFLNVITVELNFAIIGKTQLVFQFSA